ncbi:hypothetical protein [Nostoc piscinale]|uniref:hypothetical protein n=1 Tax=Nostoc piscinale TaxID=224012 RepID=UPI00118759D5|nr:hypothetical protein [Nostoc piscinale]
MLYYARGASNIPANTAIELPVQEYVTQREGNNGVVASARFPYRVTWIFRGDLPIESLPLKAVEAVVANIQVLALIQRPSVEFTQFLPFQEPDTVTLSNTEDEDRNWLLSANFSFEATFRVTTLADAEDLTSPGFFDLGEEPQVDQITIKVNKAQQGFDTTNNNTYKLDNTIILTP